MPMTPAQCRAARGLIRWTQPDLAKAAGVSDVTVRKFENDQASPQRASLDVIRRALEAAGVIFIAENGEGPGVRMRKPRQVIDAEGTPDGWTTDPDEADRGRQG